MRNKTFSLIKIAGLSIGLCVCMLILLYTRDEVSFDRFHKKHSQIYRVVQDEQWGKDAPQKLGITQSPLAPAFAKDIPEISQYVRTTQGAITVKNNNEVFLENPVFADSTFFSVFSFPLLKGNPATALNNIHSVVLSEDIAKKYFGKTEALGKTIQVRQNDEFESFIVTGVAKNSPQNSSIRFSMVLPLNYFIAGEHERWIGGSLNTFVLLVPDADVKSVEQKMQKVFDEKTKEQIAAAKIEEGISVKISLALQAITDLHLGTYGQDNGLESGSSLTYSYILSSIAIFILIVACINFINLAVAQSLKRSKEIGIRKVVGSTRKQLIRQFLVESFILTSVAFVLAVFLTITILPFFNQIANKELSFSYLADYKLYAGYFLLLLLTSVVAGSYPSLVLSSFQPVKVLYGRQKLMGKNYFTRGLIVLQFALAVFLIICTVAMYSQLNFLYNKDRGYDPKNLVRVDMPFGKNTSELFEIFKQELASNPSIVAVAGKNRGAMITGIKADEKNIETDFSKIDDKYLSVLKIGIKEGRNFSSGFPADQTQSAIVNESFVQEAGWDDPIGHTVFFKAEQKTLTVVGVIKNYNFRSLKQKIGPQLFAMDPKADVGQVWIKIKPTDIPATITAIQKTFKKISPLSPFSYQFVEDRLINDYEAEAKWKEIIGVASVLFIFISCIGLFGLVILSIEQRIKEIGIRKVMGAAVSGIAILISRDFLLLIGMAFVVAVPAGYYAIDTWLQNFVYRIDISWWMFVAAGGIMMSIPLLTISFQAIKAAMENPIKNLRTD